MLLSHDAEKSSTSSTSKPLGIRGHQLFVSVAGKLKDNVPIICHVNADTSWLLLIPFPEVQAPTAGRRYFKILVDPWFTGPQIDYYPWFSIQHHAVPSSVTTIAELNEILLELEREEIENYPKKDCLTGDEVHERDPILEHYGKNRGEVRNNAIDMVIVSHEFTDHCHKDTLIQLPPSTLLVAGNASVEKLIRSWNHFDSGVIQTMQPLDSCFIQKNASAGKRWSVRTSKNKSPSPDSEQVSCKWQFTSVGLPSWLSITRIFSPRDFPQKGFHAGVVIAFKIEDHSAKAIVYSPHGLTPAAVSPLVKNQMDPSIEPLALLHGTVKIGLAKGMMPLNLGGEPGEKVAHTLGVPYWFGTHEEEKKAGGGIAYLLKRENVKVNQKRDIQTAVFQELKSGAAAALHYS